MEASQGEIYEVVVDVLATQTPFEVGKQSRSRLDILLGVVKQRVRTAIMGGSARHELHQSLGSTLRRDVVMELRLDISHGCHESPVPTDLLGVVAEQAVVGRDMSFLQLVSLGLALFMLACLAYLVGYHLHLHAVPARRFLKRSVGLLLRDLDTVCHRDEIERTHANGSYKEYRSNYCSQSYVFVSGHFLQDILYQSFDVLPEHVDSHAVAATERHNDVGISLGWLDVQVVHRLDDALVAVDEVIDGATTLDDIAMEHTDETFVAVGIHKDFHVEYCTYRRIDQRHDALEDDDTARLDMPCLFQSAASRVVIHRLFDALALTEHVKLLEQQWPVERTRLVEVLCPALLPRKMTAVFVVRILRYDSYASFGKTLYDFADHGGLARTCAACYADDHL